MAKPKPWPAAIIGITTGAEAPPMKTASVVQRGLRGTTHLSREQLGDQGAVAADHAVGEHAHEEATDKQRRGIGELAVDDNHRSSANLERQNAGRRPALSAKKPKAEMPIIMPRTVTAVHRPIDVRLRPSSEFRYLGSHVIIPK